MIVSQPNDNFYSKMTYYVSSLYSLTVTHDNFCWLAACHVYYV